MRIPFLIIFTAILAISAFSQNHLKIGAAAPVFSATALDGNDYDLNQLRGKVVVLTFWSTKCAICSSEIPKLNRFADRFDEKNVVLIAVTMESDEKVEAYLKAKPFKFHILTNSFGVLMQYADADKEGNMDMGFPSYFLINQSGAIEYRSSGWDQTEKLDSAINRLLAK